MISATVAVTFHAYCAYIPGALVGFVIPVGFLDLCLASSSRRTPILILIAGTSLTVLVILFGTKLSSRVRAATLITSIALVIGTVLFDETVLNGQLTERVSSLSLEQSNIPETSNFEHLLDEVESFALALKAPLLGYGTG